MVFDVGEADFQQRVVDRSREVPVVVDFWAEWCGPCRALSPALERAAAARDGRIDVAKVDVDSNPRLAQTFRTQSIPAVKAFRDGRIVDEFTGALPPAQVEEFFDRLVPSHAELEAEEAERTGDEAALRRVLEADPRRASAATALARILLARGERDEALDLLEPFAHDFLAAGLAARTQLEAGGDGDELTLAFDAWDAGDRSEALERFQDAFASATDGETRDLIRQVMVAIFTELGADDPLAREHRRRLSAALY